MTTCLSIVEALGVDYSPHHLPLLTTCIRSTTLGTYNKPVVAVPPHPMGSMEDRGLHHSPISHPWRLAPVTF